MIIAHKLARLFKRLIRRLDINDIPPTSLLFLGGCLLLALIGYFSWRSDRALLANGREIRAQVIDRRTRVTEECDSNDLPGSCDTEISYFITYRYRIEAGTFTEEQIVDRDIYERTESTIPIRYLPDRPSVSNVAETVQNVTSFPLFSLVTIFIGLLGAAIIYRFQS